MSQINPLFLASTTPIGDNIVVNVELTCVLLRDDEWLYFEVKDSSGARQKIVMKKIVTKKSEKYTAQIFLTPKMPIQYCFIIECHGRELYKSANQRALADHLIADTWQASFKTVPSVKEKTIKRKVRFNKPVLLENMKSLIEELAK